MKLRRILLATVLIAVPYSMQAQTVVKRTYATPTARFASSIWVGDTLYVSGMGAPPVTPADPAKGTPAVYGDTEEQTTGALTAIEKVLKDQGLTLGDVVEMQVFLAGDPAKDGKMDFAGMNAAYAKFFGTPEQPNRPVRAALQVAALASAKGLVEIMVVAAKSAPPAKGK